MIATKGISGRKSRFHLLAPLSAMTVIRISTVVQIAASKSKAWLEKEDAGNIDCTEVCRNIPSAKPNTKTGHPKRSTKLDFLTGRGLKIGISPR